MQIKGPAIGSLTGIPTLQLRLGQAPWTTGQRLTAEVLAAGPRQPLQLQIAGETFVIQGLPPGAPPLRPGQTLQLVVTEPARDAVLRLLEGRGPLLRLPVPPETRPWQRGEVLPARLLPAGPASGALLEIAGRRLPIAPAALPAAGELRLQVLDPGRPAGLQIVATDTSPLRDQALRQALPRQQALPPLLASLRPLTTPPPSQAPLPAAIQEGLRSLLAALPTRDAVATGEGLRQALLQSGPFLEARLAEAIGQGLPGLAGPDLKAGLLGLLARLLGLRLPTGSVEARPPTNESAPPLPGGHPQAQARAAFSALDDPGETLRRLRQQVEGALARVQLVQLASLPGEEDGRRAWLLELPLRGGDDQVDVLALRIERESSGQGAEEAAHWQVTLALELPGLGPLEGRVGLREGVVSVRFQTPSADTAQFFAQHLSELQQRLRDAGLTVGSLAALPVDARDAAAGPHAGLSRGLLDEEA